MQPNCKSALAPRPHPARTPFQAEIDAMLADLDDVVVPGLTHWQHPHWFSFFPAMSSPPAVLGELAAAGLGVQGMLWSTSPAATEILLALAFPARPHAERGAPATAEVLLLAPS